MIRLLKILSRRVEAVENELKENKSMGRRKCGYGRESGGQDRGEKPANNHLNGKGPSPQGR